MKRPIDPCQAVCRLDEDDICIGCFRTREQINHWRFMDNDSKFKIIETVKPKIEARREKERLEGRASPTQRFFRE